MGSQVLENRNFLQSKQINLTESQNGTGWKGPPWVFWLNLSAQARSSQTAWHRIVPRRFFSIPSEGGSTPSPTNLSQCSVTCTVKNFSLTFRWNLLYISSCPLPVVPVQCLCQTILSQTETKAMSFSLMTGCSAEGNIESFEAFHFKRNLQRLLILFNDSLG